MKKSLLYVSLFVGSAAFAQTNCSTVFISEYVEGSGNDKAIELYNPTASAIDLTGYRLERFSNGASNSSAGGVLNLSGSIAPYSAFVIVNGQTVTSGTSPACSPALQALADLLDGVYPAPTYMNGNDAMVLYNGTTIIDIFGKTGDASMTSSDGWSDVFPYDGSAGVVWTENHTLIRKQTVLKGVMANPDPFIVTTEWDSLPENTWSNLGTHTCDCALGLGENEQDAAFSLFPNPANDVFFVNAEKAFSSLQLFDVRGNLVLQLENELAVKSMSVATNGLDKGVYVIQVNYENRSSGRKQLVIQ